MIAPNTIATGTSLSMPRQPTVQCSTSKPVASAAIPRNNALGNASSVLEYPVVASSAWNADPKDPNVTAQPLPIEGMIIAAIGGNPNPTRMGATTATGTPKPPTPCKKDANPQPITNACMPRSAVKCGKASPIWVTAPASS